MTYESYSFVSWTAGTPITGERLAQMSMNVQQVRDANDDKPSGVLVLSNGTSPIQSNASNVFTKIEIANLKYNTSSGVDQRVTIDSGRYYRINLTFPGFSVATAGGEDSVYYISFNEGSYGDGVPVERANFKVTPSISEYLDVSVSNATTAANTLTNYKVLPNRRFGAGTYSIIISSTGITNQSFYVAVGKTAGANGNTNNASAFTVVADVTTPIQFSVEDVGGVA